MIPRPRSVPEVVQIHGGPGPDIGDVEAILDLVARVEQTQWLRDADGFCALLGPQALWTTAFGRRIDGWSAIRDFTRAVLPTVLRDFQAFYEAERITFLGEGIAAVNVRQVPVDAEGNRRQDDEEGRPLYILGRYEGSWKIVMAQNTTYQSEKIATQQWVVNKMTSGQEDRHD